MRESGERGSQLLIDHGLGPKGEMVHGDEHIGKDRTSPDHTGPLLGHQGHPQFNVATVVRSCGR